MASPSLAGSGGGRVTDRARRLGAGGGVTDMDVRLQGKMLNPNVRAQGYPFERKATRLRSGRRHT